MALTSNTSTSLGAGHVSETQYLLLSDECSRDSRTELRNRNGSTGPTSLQAGLSKGHEQNTTHNLQPKHALAQRIDTLSVSRCECACGNFYVVSTANANCCVTDTKYHTSIHATVRIVQAADVLWPGHECWMTEGSCVTHSSHAYQATALNACQQRVGQLLWKGQQVDAPSCTSVDPHTA